MLITQFLAAAFFLGALGVAIATLGLTLWTERDAIIAALRNSTPPATGVVAIGIRPVRSPLRVRPRVSPLPLRAAA